MTKKVILIAAAVFMFAAIVPNLNAEETTLEEVQGLAAAINAEVGETIASAEISPTVGVILTVVDLEIGSSSRFEEERDPQCNLLGWVYVWYKGTLYKVWYPDVESVPDDELLQSGVLTLTWNN